MAIRDVHYLPGGSVCVAGPGGSGARAIVASRRAAPIEVRAPASSWFDERYPDAGGVRLTVRSLGTGAQAAPDVHGLLPMRVGVALASTAILGAVDILRTRLADDPAYRRQHGRQAPDGPLAQPAPPDHQQPDAAGWLAPEAFGVDPDERAGRPRQRTVRGDRRTARGGAKRARGVLPGRPPRTALPRVVPDLRHAHPAQGPFSAARPLLGRLELSSGIAIRLDRDVVVGRAPSGGTTGPDENVQLVQVPSPNNDISRNHVRISLEGWHVLVTDLGSTNGTLVTLPGEETVQLRPHDAMTITAGTVVALADEIEMRYDPRG